MEPEHFLDVLQGMDIGLQVSLTETFNVVCADYVTAGIPVVASKEVKWISKLCWAEDDSVTDIVNIMHRVTCWRWIVGYNQKLLCRYSEHAQLKWFQFCIAQR